MLTICPRCNLENDGNAVCSACEHVFPSELQLYHSNDSVHVLRVQRKSVIRKVLVFAGVVLSVASLSLYLGGFLRASETASSDEEPLLLAQKERGGSTAPEPIPAKVPSNDKSYKVSKVFTGDVIEIVGEDGEEYRISIFGIRAPKLNESFGAESKQHLSNLLLGKTVFIRTQKPGTDGSVVAEIICGNSNAAMAQIESGLVWLSDTNMDELAADLRRRYMDAESNAKRMKYGIWSGSDESPSVGDVALGPGPVSTGTTYVYSNGAEALPDGPNLTPPIERQPDVVKHDEPKPVQQRVLETEKPAPLVARVPQPTEAKPTPKTAVESAQTAVPNEVKTESSGSVYTRGPRGGCFYLSSKGNKVYVDRTMCN